MMSDGVTHAGIGVSTIDGWSVKEIGEFLSSTDLVNNCAAVTAALLDERCNEMSAGQFGDDRTIAVLRFCPHATANMVMGPPARGHDECAALRLFFSKHGKHIVCGGTTSQIAADYLHETIVTSLDYGTDPAIPPVGHMKGVDLVTEGVITMSRVVEYAKAFVEGTDLTNLWSVQTDGASQIAQLLFEYATDINFFIGKAINPAHQNPDLPITFGIKIRLVQELSEYLEKMGKQIKVSYF